MGAKMSTVTDIHETLRNASEPLSVSDLAGIFPSVPRRTLQRWLSQLLDDEKIQAIGEGRGRRYLMIIIAIVPGEMCIAVWSPELDAAGNSLAGTAALEKLAQRIGRSIF